MARGRQYPKELKERAVRTALESGRPITQVAEDLNIGSESLRKWVRQAEAEAGARRYVRRTQPRQNTAGQNPRS